MEKRIIEEGTCPNCQSDDIEYGAIEVSDEGIYYPCICNKCGRAFEEHYDIKFAGHMVNGEFLAV